MISQCYMILDINLDLEFLISFPLFFNRYILFNRCFQIHLHQHLCNFLDLEDQLHSFIWCQFFKNLRSSLFVVKTLRCYKIHCNVLGLVTLEFFLQFSIQCILFDHYFQKHSHRHLSNFQGLEFQWHSFIRCQSFENYLF